MQTNMTFFYILRKYDKKYIILKYYIVYSVKKRVFGQKKVSILWVSYGYVWGILWDDIVVDSYLAVERLVVEP